MTIADVTVKLVNAANKDQAVITEAVEGAAPKGICIGFSAVDNQRQVEIVQGIKQISREIIDTGVLLEGVEQIGEMPVGESTSKAIIATPVTTPLAGNLYIIIDIDYPFDVGSTGFSSDVTTALAALSDNYLKGV
jgi:hypothetical protein